MWLKIGGIKVFAWWLAGHMASILHRIWSVGIWSMMCYETMLDDCGIFVQKDLLFSLDPQTSEI